MSEARGGERTEAPSPKRRSDAAKKGDVLQSRELVTALAADRRVLVGEGIDPVDENGR